MRNRYIFQSRRSPPPIRHLLLITLIIFICVIFLSLWLIDRGIRPVLMEIAEQKTVEYATRTINAAIKSTEETSFDNLVDIQFDQNGNVATLGWDTDTANRVLRQATERAEYFLFGMNEGEYFDLDDPDLESIEFGDELSDIPAQDPTIVEIPIGQATGNTVLANLGPRIPVHFEIIGSIETDIVHEVKEFGVNAALIEIYIPVAVNMQIVIPFSTSTAEVSTRVFVDSRVIMGDVPEFYNAGGSDGPSISVPRYPSE